MWEQAKQAEELLKNPSQASLKNPQITTNRTKQKPKNTTQNNKSTNQKKRTTKAKKVLIKTTRPHCSKMNISAWYLKSTSRQK